MKGHVERPFAYCCAEAGGDVTRCDCVSKNHGTAWFSSVKPVERMTGTYAAYEAGSALEARAREILRADAYSRQNILSSEGTRHDEEGRVTIGTAISAMMTLAREVAIGAGEALRWRERWYGSEPQKGSAIVDERGNLIAYFGGDRETHKAATAIAAAHNAALAPASASIPGDVEREALRREIINTPETADFMAGVPLEAIHQRERWGSDHDTGKTPFDWFWLIGYLAQKAADAATRGDLEKAQHHTISTAAALANWHAALTGADTSMRPGIEPPAALAARPSTGGAMDGEGSR